jgi:hypothetical protein
MIPLGMILDQVGPIRAILARCVGMGLDLVAYLQQFRDFLFCYQADLVPLTIPDLLFSFVVMPFDIA